MGMPGIEKIDISLTFFEQRYFNKYLNKTFEIFSVYSSLSYRGNRVSDFFYLGLSFCFIKFIKLFLKK